MNLVIASRLEKMKGVSVGIDAVVQVSRKWRDLKLSIIGAGPEGESLKKEVASKYLDEATVFEGQLDYPDKFLGRLRDADYVLLTNLNDEQPRLIFDAISQGAIPICPKHLAYSALGLNSDIMYQQGDSRDLSHVLLSLMKMEPARRQQIQKDLGIMAKNHTLEEMHRRRAEWIDCL